jgi:large subunit ribosomal protein L15
MGSGKGRYSGRGIKGQKARSGSAKMRAGFEGGQMPVYMRLGKLRGPNHKKSMPLGPFRTYSVPVNLRELDRFEAGVEVTPQLLRAAGVVRTRKHPVKILGEGTLSKALTVRAHGFSKSARAAIEAAGGQALAVEDEQAQPQAAEPAATVEAEPEPSAEPAASGEHDVPAAEPDEE